MLNVIRFLATAALAAVFTSAWAGVSGAPAAMGHAGHMPEIDQSKTPARDTPSLLPRFKAANASINDQRPAPDPRGAFRITCAFSHFLFDDPLVKPGIPGGSHGHTFAGNGGANAYSDVANLRGAGSSCAGGGINQSAYWVPGMVDTSTGEVLRPHSVLIYYKCDYQLSASECANIQAPPPGMAMIAGSMANTALAGPYEFKCDGSGAAYKSIPDCPAGSILWMSVMFPQCVKVDADGYPVPTSADHKSHVANPVGGKCPASHPYAIPKITQVFKYVVEPGQLLRLSSDQHGAPAGTSAHADWVNGWDQAELELAVQKCTAGGLNCHTNLLPPSPGETVWRLLY